VLGCQKLQTTAKPGLAQDAYSCTHMATVDVKGLRLLSCTFIASKSLIVRHAAGLISSRLTL